MSCKLYAPNTNGRLSLFLSDNDSIYVDYAKKSDAQEIQLVVTNHEVTGLRLSLYQPNESVYLDEFNITPQ